MKNIVSGLVVVLVLAISGGATLMLRFLNTSSTTFSGNIDFVVQPGPFSRTAAQLEQVGAVSSARMLRLYVRLTHKADALKTGEYELKSGMTPIQILDVLLSGKSKTYPVTIQEGLNVYEIAELLEGKGLVKKSEFLNLCKNKDFIKELLKEDLPSLEGYLFPNTYLFSRFTSPKEMIREMVGQFLTVYSEIEAGEQLVKMKRKDAVILASIIEKETGVPEERGLVSSVFHNRIVKGMMLQTDPTVIYGILDKTGTMPKNIRKSDLLDPSRYNTYTFHGLPFGPISNPGKEALYAAHNPETSEFLYFVSKNDGTHTFTSTYKDHSRAVEKFQIDRKQREGKSWRDFSKKSKH